MAVSISIIICTRNRASHLRQTLAAMAEVCLPQGWKAEMLVIDNGSTDDTAQIAVQCCLSNMAVRYFYEPKRGQCHARNLGLREAHGDMIVFTDDDVRPSRNWLQDLCTPLLAGAASAVAGGVTIAPHLERPGSAAGSWIRLASTEATDLKSPDIIGANMAFCRSLLKLIPQFDTELGPGALGFGDDTLFGWQMRAAGFRTIFRPEATLEHHFEASRMTRSSLVSMAKKQGRSAAYLDYHWQHREEKSALRLLTKRSLRLALWRWTRQQDIRQCAEAPAWELNILRDIAYFRQFLKEQRRPKNYRRYGLAKITEAKL